MDRLRTRLQKRLNSANGEKKTSLVAQLKELREDFQREHARLAESEKSGRRYRSELTQAVPAGDVTRRPSISE